MAKEVGTCSYSKCTNTFTKRNYKQHACCASHRTLSNREKAKSANTHGYEYKPKKSVGKNFSVAAVKAAIPAIMSGNNSVNVLEAVGTAVVTSTCLLYTSPSPRDRG